MVDFEALNFPIETPGADAALRTFDQLNAKGRKVMEDYAGNTAKSLDQVTRDFQANGHAIDDSMLKAKYTIESVTKATDALAASSERAAMAMETSMSRATQSATRGLEIMARTGTVTGRSMDQILASVSKMAFGFGSTGLLVGALAIGAAAVYEFFNKARKELEKTQEEFNKRIEEMRRKGQGEGISEDARLIQGDVDEAKRALSTLEIRTEAARVKMEQLHEEVGRGSPLWKKAHSEWITLSNEELALIDKREAGEKSLARAMQAELNLRQPKTGAGTPPIVSTAQSGKGEESEVEKSHKNVMEEMRRFNAELDRMEEEQARRALSTELESARSSERIAHESAMKIKEEREKNDLDFLKFLEKIDEAGKSMEKAAADSAKRVGDAFASALTSAFSSGGGGIQGAFKKLTALLLESLGDMMIRYGEASAAFISFIAKIQSAISFGNPVLGLAASLALIAAGAALKSAASSIGSSGSGGGGGSGVSSYASSPMNGTVLVGAPPATPSTANMSARPTLNVTANIIGKDDPAAQRQLLEMISRAQRRGSTLG